MIIAWIRETRGIYLQCCENLKMPPHWSFYTGQTLTVGSISWSGWKSLCFSAIVCSSGVEAWCLIFSIIPVGNPRISFTVKSDWAKASVVIYNMTWTNCGYIQHNMKNLWLYTVLQRDILWYTIKLFQTRSQWHNFNSWDKRQLNGVTPQFVKFSGGVMSTDNWSWLITDQTWARHRDFCKV